MSPRLQDRQEDRKGDAVGMITARGGQIEAGRGAEDKRIGKKGIPNAGEDVTATTERGDLDVKIAAKCSCDTISPVSCQFMLFCTLHALN